VSTGTGFIAITQFTHGRFSPIPEAKLPQVVFERNSFEVGDVCLEIKDIGDWKSILDPFIQIPSIIPWQAGHFAPQIPFVSFSFQHPDTLPHLEHVTLD